MALDYDRMIDDAHYCRTVSGDVDLIVEFSNRFFSGDTLKMALSLVKFDYGTELKKEVVLRGIFGPLIRRYCVKKMHLRDGGLFFLPDMEIYSAVIRFASENKDIIGSLTSTGISMGRTAGEVIYNLGFGEMEDTLTVFTDLAILSKNHVFTGDLFRYFQRNEGNPVARKVLEEMFDTLTHPSAIQHRSSQIDKTLEFYVKNHRSLERLWRSGDQFDDLFDAMNVVSAQLSKYPGAHALQQKAYSLCSSLFMIDKRQVGWFADAMDVIETSSQYPLENLIRDIEMEHFPDMVAAMERYKDFELVKGCIVEIKPGDSNLKRLLQLDIDSIPWPHLRLLTSQRYPGLASGLVYGALKSLIDIAAVDRHGGYLEKILLNGTHIFKDDPAAGLEFIASLGNIIHGLISSGDTESADQIIDNLMQFE